MFFPTPANFPKFLLWISNIATLAGLTLSLQKIKKSMPGLKALLFVLVMQAWCLPVTVSAQHGEDGRNSSGQIRRQCFTHKVDEGSIKLDGSIDEAVWSTVAWSGDFIQYQPDEGKAPYQPTQFKILQDDKYLYFAARAFDQQPDSIIERLSRRDEFPGDWIEINIDSYHDLRSAFSFTLSVSGVKGDEFISENGNHWDDSWNPIWDLVTHIDSLGWTAEARIPFSQLRYGNQADPVWGIQVQRRIFRKEERSTWQSIPQNSGGWVSEFGELRGLQSLPDKKQVELAPYVLAQTERYEPEAGNPYADGTDSKVNVGLDGKIAVTRDMIVDFTINPDFGQVEADPGALRLDGYEIFFDEKRPFFIENRNLFDYQLTGSQAGGQYDQDQLFYSRRIGGTPHIVPETADGEYSKIPDFTSIVGAGKFSGKTKKGVSIGLLECLTKNEYAKISDGVHTREELVEPLTNYFVARGIKDYNKGNTVVGGIFSAVNRKEGLPQLHDAAYSGALDYLHYWKNRWWFFNAKLMISRVEGSTEAISNTQQSFVHLFQRADADYVDFDSTRTSLMGTGGTLKIGKFGGKQTAAGGILKFESGITWRSPELELNDIGFLGTTDEINHFTWIGYQFQKPFSIFRNAQLNYNHWARWDFGGRFTYLQFNTNVHGWFKNNWMVGGGFDWNPLEISNNALRGASALRKLPGYGISVNVQSDERGQVVVGVNWNGGHGYQKAVQYQSVGTTIQFQPSDALQFSLAPSYSRTMRKQDQFVDNVSYEGQTRSIVSHVDNQTFSLVTRLNYYITPDLSIQYYGEPFIFRAKYNNYGYVKDPLNKSFDDRFHVFAENEIQISGNQATVDENGDGQEDYSFSTPDLNYIQFRSNLVLRWEYVPGSELYLVWSQGILPNAYDDFSTPLLKSLFTNVFDEQPHNIFLVKVSYRFLN
jgi:hypothetical protein